jgi:hypothetical protein
VTPPQPRAAVDRAEGSGSVERRKDSWRGGRVGGGGHHSEEENRVLTRREEGVAR